jgi:hypothetical protein
MWDPTISVASVSIYPHFGTGFLEICLVLSWQALASEGRNPEVSVAILLFLAKICLSHWPYQKLNN